MTVWILIMIMTVKLSVAQSVAVTQICKLKYSCEHMYDDNNNI